MKRIYGPFILSMLLLFFVSTLSAQDANNDMFGEEEQFFQVEEQVVLSASKREQKISESPVAITVITREDIERSGFQTIPDVLRMVPGVFVSRVVRGDPQVAIRGLINTPPEAGMMQSVSRNILLLLNGRSFFNDIYGAIHWNMLPITVQDIERIEVVRGPSSALFGANAVTGVINIILRDPLALKKFDGKLTAGNDYNNMFLSVMAEEKYKEWGWRFTAEDSKIAHQGRYEEYDHTRQIWVPGRGIGGDFNHPSAAGLADYNMSRVDLNAAFEFNPQNSFNLQAGRSNGAVTIPGINGDLLKPHYYTDTLFLLGTYNTHIGKSQAKLMTSWRNDRIGKSLLRTPMTADKAPDGLGIKSFDTEGQVIINVSKDDILVTGFNWRKTYSKSEGVYFLDGTEPNQSFLAFFFNNEYRISELWKIVAGVRIDDFDYPDDTAVSPQAILVYEPNARATWRLNYSEAIRTAFISDLFLNNMVNPFNYGDSFRAGIFQTAQALGLPSPPPDPDLNFLIGPIALFGGNKDLDFPKIRSLELGSSFQIGKNKHSLDVSLFTYRVTDSIIWKNAMLDFAWPTLTLNLIKNSGDPLQPYYKPGYGFGGNLTAAEVKSQESALNFSFKNDPNDIKSLGIEIGTKLKLAKKIMGWMNMTLQRTKYNNQRTKAAPEVVANLGISADVRNWKVDFSMNYSSETVSPVTNILDQNADILDDLAANPAQNLCPGQNLAMGGCIIDPDPDINNAILSAAASTFWCDLQNYDARNANPGAMALCPSIPVTPASADFNNSGWWDIFSDYTVPSVYTTYPGGVPTPVVNNLTGNPVNSLANLPFYNADPTATFPVMGSPIDGQPLIGLMYSWAMGDPALIAATGVNPDPFLAGLAQTMLAVERTQASSMKTTTLGTDGYFLFNLRIAKNIISDELEFYAACENIFDEKHREYAYGDMLERRFTAGLNWNF